VVSFAGWFVARARRGTPSGRQADDQDNEPRGWRCSDYQCTFILFILIVAFLVCRKRGALCCWKTLRQGCSHSFSMRATYKMIKPKWSTTKMQNIYFSVNILGVLFTIPLQNIKYRESYRRLNAQTDMSVHRRRGCVVRPTHSNFEIDW